MMPLLFLWLLSLFFFDIENKHGASLKEDIVILFNKNTKDKRTCRVFSLRLHFHITKCVFFKSCIMDFYFLSIERCIFFSQLVASGYSMGYKSRVHK